MENGEPFVIWDGILMMLELSVDNWDMLMSFLLAQSLIFCMLVGMDAFGKLMLTVLEMKEDLENVSLHNRGETQLDAVIAWMLLCSAIVSNILLLYILLPIFCGVYTHCYIYFPYYTFFFPMQQQEENHSQLK